MGHFFRPRLRTCPSLAELMSYRPSMAILILRFGDGPIVEGRWPVIGPLPGWRRGDWGVQYFIRQELITNRVLRVEYDDRHRAVAEVPLRAVDETLPPATLLGRPGVEHRLDEALAAEEGLG